MITARVVSFFFITALLLVRADDPGTDANGRTPLMQAVIANDEATVKTLIDQKISLNAQDKDGRTALIWACSVDNEKLAEALAAAGADLNIADTLGETAVSHANDIGLSDLAAFFETKGANAPIVHIIAKPQPQPPLPPARAWALAVGVIYTQKFGYNPHVLGGQPFDVNMVKTMLSRDWNIRDKDGLLKELDDLRDRGHHVAFQTGGAHLAGLSDADFQQLLQTNPTKVNRLKAERASYLKWQDRSGLAWDLCRSAMLVNSGYAVGFITEQEAWDRLMPIAQKTQASFSSWNEMDDNFLDGREIWANGPSERNSFLGRLLLNPEDANSPWNQNPWKTDLSTPAPAN